MTDQPANPGVRIDRWLWAARAYKTRSIASQACNGGKVTVNDSSAKPHKLVRPGDEVEFRAGAFDKRWKILALSEQRGPAPTAQALYQDLTPPPPPREDKPYLDASYLAPRSRRPNKRERRQIDRFKRS